MLSARSAYQAVHAIHPFLFPNGTVIEIIYEDGSSESFVSVCPGTVPHCVAPVPGTQRNSAGNLLAAGGAGFGGSGSVGGGGSYGGTGGPSSGAGGGITCATVTSPYGSTTTCFFRRY